jgi:hypothetical protein
MGIINFSIPNDIVLEIINKVKFNNFIETGTYKGETSFWAAQYFEKVYTIEIDPEISKITSSQIDVPENIHFLIGNSKDLLKPLVSQITGRSFFWLDGHWCSGAGGKDEECPLYFELEAISNLHDSVVFIDDARCFLGPLPPPHNHADWPLIDDLICKLKLYFPRSFVTIIDDVIICVPDDVKKVVFNYWMNTFNDRFPVHEKVTNDSDLLKKISKRTILKYLFGFISQ